MANRENDEVGRRESSINSEDELDTKGGQSEESEHEKTGHQNENEGSDSSELAG